MKNWFKQILLPKLIGYTAKIYLIILYYTCRYKVEGIEQYKDFAGKEKVIIAFWHNRVVFSVPVLQKFAPDLYYAALISSSRDGKILSTIVDSYSHSKSIPVPHNNRLGALNKTIDHLNNEKDILLITPDGPRGPRYKIKPGLIQAAKNTGAFIFPFSCSVNSFWQLKTWDKMMVPKPFSTIHVNFGDPIRLNNDGAIPSEEETTQIEKAILHTDEKACVSITADRALWPK